MHRTAVLFAVAALVLFAGPAGAAQCEKWDGGAIRCLIRGEKVQLSVRRVAEHRFAVGFEIWQSGCRGFGRSTYRGTLALADAEPVPLPPMQAAENECTEVIFNQCLAENRVEMDCFGTIEVVPAPR